MIQWVEIVPFALIGIGMLTSLLCIFHRSEKEQEETSRKMYMPTSVLMEELLAAREKKHGKG